MKNLIPKRLSWTAIAVLRAASIALVLAAGAILLHGELAHGQALDREIRQRSEEAETRIDQGARARQFHEVEEPVVLEIESKLLESAPKDTNAFKAFCLNEAQAEELELIGFRCEKGLGENARPSSREDRSKGGKVSEPAPSSPFVEVPFSVQGRGNYGSILRFCDRVHTNRGLVAVDKFAIARSSVFSQYQGGGARGAAAAKASEEELPPESHSFVFEGRVFLLASKEEEER